MNTNTNAESKKGILKPLSLGASMAFVYVLLFIAMMLISNKILSTDVIVLPALLIFMLVSIIKYFVIQENQETPQWLIISSFVLAAASAVVMAVIR